VTKTWALSTPLQVGAFRILLAVVVPDIICPLCVGLQIPISTMVATHPRLGRRLRFLKSPTTFCRRPHHESFEMFKPVGATSGPEMDMPINVKFVPDHMPISMVICQDYSLFHYSWRIGNILDASVNGALPKEEL